MKDGKIASCPFCRQKYAIGDLPPGSRVLCTKCNSRLIVPRIPSKRGWSAIMLFSREVAVAVVSGIAAAFLMFLLLRGEATQPQLPSPSISTDRSAIEAKPFGPEYDAKSPAVAARIDLWEERKGKQVDALCREFGVHFFNFNAATRPYLVAIEKSERYYFNRMAQDYVDKLQALYAKFLTEFKDPVGLRDIDDGVLVVVVFKSRESFDDYFKKAHGKPMTSLINGLYEFNTKRLVTYHDNRAPFDVIFHEGVHQLVDHYTKSAKTSTAFWFQEGLANCFEAFRWQDGQIVPDSSINSRRFQNIRQAVVAKNFVPLSEFVTITTDDVWNNINSGKLNDEQLWLYYAEAWALVYFLRNGEQGKYGKPFSKYFRDVLNGNGGIEDFIRSFDDLNAVESEFEKFVMNLKE